MRIDDLAAMHCGDADTGLPVVELMSVDGPIGSGAVLGTPDAVLLVLGAWVVLGIKYLFTAGVAD